MPGNHPMQYYGDLTESSTASLSTGGTFQTDTTGTIAFERVRYLDAQGINRTFYYEAGTPSSPQPRHPRPPREATPTSRRTTTPLWTPPARRTPTTLTSSGLAPSNTRRLVLMQDNPGAALVDPTGMWAAREMDGPYWTVEKMSAWSVSTGSSNSPTFDWDMYEAIFSLLDSEDEKDGTLPINKRDKNEDLRDNDETQGKSNGRKKLRWNISAQRRGASRAI